MADGASPRSLVTGVGLGLVGMVTKPLSGAAELVALTGQGNFYHKTSYNNKTREGKRKSLGVNTVKYSVVFLRELALS